MFRVNWGLFPEINKLFVLETRQHFTPSQSKLKWLALVTVACAHSFFTIKVCCTFDTLNVWGVEVMTPKSYVRGSLTLCRG